MESNTNTNTEAQEVDVNSTPEQVENSTNNDNPSTEVTFTEAEVASRVSRAVQLALDKQRKNQAKSNEDIAQELAELKAQLAQKENESYVASEVTKNNLPSELLDLFYGVDNEESARKIKSFKKWYSNAVDTAVENRLNATQTPVFGASTPGVSSKKQAVGTFAQFLERENK